MGIQTRVKGSEAVKIVNNPTKTNQVVVTNRGRMIQEAAYFLAQKRGFQPGHDLEDWLAAERQVCALARRSD